MKISITGCMYTPKWDSLQTIICECVDDEHGVIVSIAGKDRKTWYRGRGKYDISFRSKGTTIAVELHVQR